MDQKSAAAWFSFYRRKCFCFRNTLCRLVGPDDSSPPWQLLRTVLCLTVVRRLEQAGTAGRMNGRRLVALLKFEREGHGLPFLRWRRLPTLRILSDRTSFSVSFSWCFGHTFMVHQYSNLPPPGPWCLYVRSGTSYLVFPVLVSQVPGVCTLLTIQF